VSGRKAQQPPPGTPGFFGRLLSRGPTEEARAEAAAREEPSEQERIITEALADLRDMDVREVMTPRVDVVALTIPIAAEDVARAVRESGFTCFPVVHDDLDDLVGVLYVKDLFRPGRRGGNEELPEPGLIDISRRLRQPYLVPESRRVLDALAEMRKERRGFGVVVDEYGGVAGVVTIKDLLEPLVGDLSDEFDPDEEPDVVRVDGSRWLVDGQTNVDEVNDLLGIDLPDGEYVTLGGFLFDGFGHIPEEGESLQVGDWELQVVAMDRRRVAKVVARRATTAADTAGTRPGGEAVGGPAAADEAEADRRRTASGTSRRLD
jgi:putative hemolysin